MATERTPLFVRLPRRQAAALDRLVETTGRPKQHLISELLGNRLDANTASMPIGRVEIANRDSAVIEDVLTLDEVAAMLKLPVDVFRTRVESGDVPGRRFGADWRFARSAVLDWLTAGERRRRSLLD